MISLILLPFTPMTCPTATVVVGNEVIGQLEDWLMITYHQARDISQRSYQLLLKSEWMIVDQR